MPLNRIGSAGLLLALGACSSVRNVQPSQFIPEHKPQVVWVTFTDNAFAAVAEPQIVGDTLKGTWKGLARPLVTPLNRIQTVRARVPDHERTIILFTTLVAVTGGSIYWMTQGSGPALQSAPGTTCGTYIRDGIYTCWNDN